VLLSSIFFMADSVVSGNFTTANSSSFWAEGALQGTEDLQREACIPDHHLPPRRACASTCHKHTLVVYRTATHLMRGYFGARAFFSVFGLWKTTEYRGLCCFLNTPFLTALAAFAALALVLSAQRCTHERERLSLTP